MWEYTVPTQCKNLRRNIRRQRHKFLIRVNDALTCIMPCIHVLIMDYCLPSRKILDAIESTAHPGTDVIVQTKDVLGKIECELLYAPSREQGYDLYPDYRG